MRLAHTIIVNEYVELPEHELHFAKSLVDGVVGLNVDLDRGKLAFGIRKFFPGGADGVLRLVGGAAANDDIVSVTNLELHRVRTIW